MSRAGVLPWRDLIVITARGLHIDPSFGAAIVSIESDGNASAGVDKFAQRPDGSWYSVVTYPQGIGLTQVIPVEAPGDWGGRPSVGQLLEPAFNLSYGFGILADDLARCGSKERAACAYFAGHCIPTGAADASGATDFTYIARAMANEQLFLDFNQYDPEADMIRQNGTSQYFAGRVFPAGDYVIDCDFDFHLPPEARGVVLELFLAADTGSGLVSLADGDHAYAGQVGGQHGRYRQVLAFITPLPERNGSRGVRFKVSDGSIRFDLVGIVGRF